MELRDEFAREAMKEMNWTSDPEHMKGCAETCYAIADAMMAARGDWWIEWSGGDECPVPSGVKFHIRLRSGDEWLCERADFLDWTHEVEPNDYDIVAYRIDK